ncbi:uncharacterized protein MONOS_5934 [Monocercomonoides exilis]|uniref:uncharacterized protein n=1 Tax=Monocercomonoides exilis TaxID=2049356 RepID=UPI00355A76E5|nr:hypothetical protein MONOS_5934 [Monocercomonoides exilis]|eukprot:MONOS_5934.1-p1 / transcript=MONOS_5934.1 / gene=MONOS_5934 / organism=Monocercomonoides_exilis_PA203 / gene_product=unspecified product / transcript_product=unspecified product / location=Mono_scaffold00179:31708-49525(+) / protein_length=5867 / sequence_SO=supercontig / SO=protein_coding / is_pseudo=false
MFSTIFILLSYVTFYQAINEPNGFSPNVLEKDGLNSNEIRYANALSGTGYVSSLGIDENTCGEIDNPCLTVQKFWTLYSSATQVTALSFQTSTELATRITVSRSYTFTGSSSSVLDLSGQGCFALSTSTITFQTISLALSGTSNPAFSLSSGTLVLSLGRITGTSSREVVLANGGTVQVNSGVYSSNGNSFIKSNSATLNLQGGTISTRGAINGGGINADGGTLTVSGTTFSSCSATGAGGAIYFSFTGTPSYLFTKGCFGGGNSAPKGNIIYMAGPNFNNTVVKTKYPGDWSSVTENDLYGLQSSSSICPYGEPLLPYLYPLNDVTIYVNQSKGFASPACGSSTTQCKNFNWTELTATRAGKTTVSIVVTEDATYQETTSMNFNGKTVTLKGKSKSYTIVRPMFGGMLLKTDKAFNVQNIAFLPNGADGSEALLSISNSATLADVEVKSANTKTPFLSCSSTLSITGLQISSVTFSKAGSFISQTGTSSPATFDSCAINSLSLTTAGSYFFNTATSGAVSLTNVNISSLSSQNEESVVFRVQSGSVGGSFKYENSRITGSNGRPGKVVHLKNKATATFTSLTIQSFSGNVPSMFAKLESVTTMTVKSSAFSQIASGCNGYGFCVSKGNFVMNDTTFTTCSSNAISKGGAIALFDGANIEINGGKFQSVSMSNTGAEALGGCVYCSNPTKAKFSSVTFNATFASGGGAICIEGGTNLVLTDCNFISCTAKGTVGGGAVYSKATNLEINGTTSFSSCTTAATNTSATSLHGGGIWATGQSLVLKGIFAEKCTAYKGGFLHFTQTGSASTVTITNCEVINSTAHNTGGGMHIEATTGANVNMDTNIFTNCFAEFGGGVSIPIACQFNVNRLTCTKCKGGIRGGGIEVHSDVAKTSNILSNCEFAENTAGSGGGADIYDYNAAGINYWNWSNVLTCKSASKPNRFVTANKNYLDTFLLPDQTSTTYLQYSIIVAKPDGNVDGRTRHNHDNGNDFQECGGQWTPCATCTYAAQRSQQRAAWSGETRVAEILVEPGNFIETTIDFGNDFLEMYSVTAQDSNIIADFSNDTAPDHHIFHVKNGWIRYFRLTFSATNDGAYVGPMFGITGTGGMCWTACILTQRTSAAGKLQYPVVVSPINTFVCITTSSVRNIVLEKHPVVWSNYPKNFTITKSNVSNIETTCDQGGFLNVTMSSSSRCYIEDVDFSFCKALGPSGDKTSFEEWYTLNTSKGGCVMMTFQPDLLNVQKVFDYHIWRTSWNGNEAGHGPDVFIEGFHFDTSVMPERWTGSYSTSTLRPNLWGWNGNETEPLNISTSLLYYLFRPSDSIYVFGDDANHIRCGHWHLPCQWLNYSHYRLTNVTNYQSELNEIRVSNWPRPSTVHKYTHLVTNVIHNGSAIHITTNDTEKGTVVIDPNNQFVVRPGSSNTNLMKWSKICIRLPPDSDKIEMIDQDGMIILFDNCIITHNDTTSKSTPLGLVTSAGGKVKFETVEIKELTFLSEHFMIDMSGTTCELSMNNVRSSDVQTTGTGLIRLTNAASMKITNSIFTRGTSAKGSYFLNKDVVETVVANCDFSQIVATATNGSVFNYHLNNETNTVKHSIIFRDTTFSDCESNSFDGGAIYIVASMKSAFQTHNCIFTACKAYTAPITPPTHSASNQAVIPPDYEVTTLNGRGGGIYYEIIGSVDDFNKVDYQFNHTSFSNCNATLGTDIYIEGFNFDSNIWGLQFNYSYTRETPRPAYWGHNANANENVSTTLLYWLFRPINEIYVDDSEKNHIRCGHDLLPCGKVDYSHWHTQFTNHPRSGVAPEKIQFWHIDFWMPGVSTTHQLFEQSGGNINIFNCTISSRSTAPDFTVECGLLSATGGSMNVTEVVLNVLHFVRLSQLVTVSYDADITFLCCNSTGISSDSQDILEAGTNSTGILEASYGGSIRISDCNFTTGTFTDGGFIRGVLPDEIHIFNFSRFDNFNTEKGNGSILNTWLGHEEPTSVHRNVDGDRINHVIIENCSFNSNNALTNHGGSLHCRLANPGNFTVADCTFDASVANKNTLGNGGGIYLGVDECDPSVVYLFSSLLFTNCDANLGKHIYVDGCLFDGVVTNPRFVNFVTEETPRDTLWGFNADAPENISTTLMYYLYRPYNAIYVTDVTEDTEKNHIRCGHYIVACGKLDYAYWRLSESQVIAKNIREIRVMTRTTLNYTINFDGKNVLMTTNQTQATIYVDPNTQLVYATSSNSESDLVRAYKLKWILPKSTDKQEFVSMSGGEMMFDTCQFVCVDHQTNFRFITITYGSFTVKNSMIDQFEFVGHSTMLDARQNGVVTFENSVINKIGSDQTGLFQVHDGAEIIFTHTNVSNCAQPLGSFIQSDNANRICITNSSTFENFSTTTSNGSMIIFDVREGNKLQIDGESEFHYGSTEENNGGSFYMRLDPLGEIKLSNSTITHSTAINGNGGAIYVIMTDDDSHTYIYDFSFLSWDRNQAIQGPNLYMRGPFFTDHVTDQCFNGSYSLDYIDDIWGFDTQTQRNTTLVDYFDKVTVSVYVKESNGSNFEGCGALLSPCQTIEYAYVRSRNTKVGKIVIMNNAELRQTLKNQGEVIIEGFNNSLLHVFNLTNLSSTSSSNFDQEAVFETNSSTTIRSLLVVVPSNIPAEKIFKTNKNALIFNNVELIPASSLNAVFPTLFSVQGGRLELINTLIEGITFRWPSFFVELIDPAEFYTDGLLVREMTIERPFINVSPGITVQITNSNLEKIHFPEHMIVDDHGTVLEVNSTTFYGMSTSNQNGTVLNALIGTDDVIVFNDNNNFQLMSSDDLNGGSMFVKVESNGKYHVIATNISNSTAHPVNGKGGGIYLHLLNGSTMDYLFSNMFFSNNSAEEGNNIYIYSEDLEKTIIEEKFDFDYNDSTYDEHSFVGRDDNEYQDDIDIRFFFRDFKNRVIYCQFEGRVDSQICGKKKDPCKTMTHGYTHLDQDLRNLELRICITTYLNRSIDVSDTLIAATDDDFVSIKIVYIGPDMEPGDGHSPLLYSNETFGFDRVSVYFPEDLNNRPQFLKSDVGSVFINSSSFVFPIKYNSTYSIPFVFAEIETGDLSIIDMSVSDAHLFSSLFTIHDYTKISVSSLYVDSLKIGEGPLFDISSVAIPCTPGPITPGVVNYPVAFENCNLKGITREDVGPAIVNLQKIEDASGAGDECWKVKISGTIVDGCTSHMSQPGTVISIEGWEVLINSTQFLGTNISASTDATAVCSWTSSFLHLGNCKSTIEYSSFKNSPDGALSVTGGHVTIHMASFENNSPRLRFYPSARRNIHCDGGSTIKIESVEPDDELERSDNMFMDNGNDERECVLSGPVFNNRMSWLFIPTLTNGSCSDPEDDIITIEFTGTSLLPCCLTFEIFRYTTTSDGQTLETDITEFPIGQIVYHTESTAYGPINSSLVELNEEWWTRIIYSGNDGSQHKTQAVMFKPITIQISKIGAPTVLPPFLIFGLILVLLIILLLLFLRNRSRKNQKAQMADDLQAQLEEQLNAMREPLEMNGLDGKVPGLHESKFDEDESDSERSEASSRPSSSEGSSPTNALLGDKPLLRSGRRKSKKSADEAAAPTMFPSLGARGAGPRQPDYSRGFEPADIADLRNNGMSPNFGGLVSNVSVVSFEHTNITSRTNLMSDPDIPLTDDDIERMAFGEDPLTTSGFLSPSELSPSGSKKTLPDGLSSKANSQMSSNSDRNRPSTFSPRRQNSVLGGLAPFRSPLANPPQTKKGKAGKAGKGGRDDSFEHDELPTGKDGSSPFDRSAQSRTNTNPAGFMFPFPSAGSPGANPLTAYQTNASGTGFNGSTAAQPGQDSPFAAASRMAPGSQMAPSAGQTSGSQASSSLHNRTAEHNTLISQQSSRMLQSTSVVDGPMMGGRRRQDFAGPNSEQFGEQVSSTFSPSEPFLGDYPTCNKSGSRQQNVDASGMPLRDASLYPASASNGNAANKFGGANSTLGRNPSAAMAASGQASRASLLPSSSSDSLGRSEKNERLAQSSSTVAGSSVGGAATGSSIASGLGGRRKKHATFVVGGDGLNDDINSVLQLAGAPSASSASSSSSASPSNMPSTSNITGAPLMLSASSSTAQAPSSSAFARNAQNQNLAQSAAGDKLSQSSTAFVGAGQYAPTKAGSKVERPSSKKRRQQSFAVNNNDQLPSSNEPLAQSSSQRSSPEGDSFKSNGDSQAMNAMNSGSAISAAAGNAISTSKASSSSQQPSVGITSPSLRSAQATQNNGTTSNIPYNLGFDTLGALGGRTAHGSTADLGALASVPSSSSAKADGPLKRRKRQASFAVSDTDALLYTDRPSNDSSKDETRNGDILSQTAPNGASASSSSSSDQLSAAEASKIRQGSQATAFGSNTPSLSSSTSPNAIGGGRTAQASSASLGANASAPTSASARADGPLNRRKRQASFAVDDGRNESVGATDTTEPASSTDESEESNELGSSLGSGLGAMSFVPSAAAAAILSKSASNQLSSSNAPQASKQSATNEVDNRRIAQSTSAALANNASAPKTSSSLADGPMNRRKLQTSFSVNDHSGLLPDAIDEVDEEQLFSQENSSANTKNQNEMKRLGAANTSASTASASSSVSPQSLPFGASPSGSNAVLSSNSAFAPSGAFGRTAQSSSAAMGAKAAAPSSSTAFAEGPINRRKRQSSFAAAPVVGDPFNQQSDSAQDGNEDEEESNAELMAQINENILGTMEPTNSSYAMSSAASSILSQSASQSAATSKDASSASAMSASSGAKGRTVQASSASLGANASAPITASSRADVLLNRRKRQASFAVLDQFNELPDTIPEEDNENKDAFETKASSGSSALGSTGNSQMFMPSAAAAAILAKSANKPSSSGVAPNSQKSMSSHGTNERFAQSSTAQLEANVLAPSSSSSKADGPLNRRKRQASFSVNDLESPSSTDSLNKLIAGEDSANPELASILADQSNPTESSGISFVPSAAAAAILAHAASNSASSSLSPSKDTSSAASDAVVGRTAQASAASLGAGASAPKSVSSRADGPMNRRRRQSSFTAGEQPSEQSGLIFGGSGEEATLEFNQASVPSGLNTSGSVVSFVPYSSGTSQASQASLQLLSLAEAPSSQSKSISSEMGGRSAQSSAAAVGVGATATTASSARADGPLNRRKRQASFTASDFALSSSDSLNALMTGEDASSSEMNSVHPLQSSSSESSDTSEFSFVPSAAAAAILAKAASRPTASSTTSSGAVADRAAQASSASLEANAAIPVSASARADGPMNRRRRQGSFVAISPSDSAAEGEATQDLLETIGQSSSAESSSLGFADRPFAPSASAAAILAKTASHPTTSSSVSISEGSDRAAQASAASLGANASAPTSASVRADGPLNRRRRQASFAVLNANDEIGEAIPEGEESNELGSTLGGALGTMSFAPSAAAAAILSKSASPSSTSAAIGESVQQKAAQGSMASVGLDAAAPSSSTAVSDDVMNRRKRQASFAVGEQEEKEYAPEEYLSDEEEYNDEEEMEEMGSDESDYMSDEEYDEGSDGDYEEDQNQLQTDIASMGDSMSQSFIIPSSGVGASSTAALARPAPTKAGASAASVNNFATAGIKRQASSGLLDGAGMKGRGLRRRQTFLGENAEEDNKSTKQEGGKTEEQREDDILSEITHGFEEYGVDGSEANLAGITKSESRRVIKPRDPKQLQHHASGYFVPKTYVTDYSHVKSTMAGISNSHSTRRLHRNRSTLLSKQPSSSQLSTTDLGMQSSSTTSLAAEASGQTVDRPRRRRRPLYESTIDTGRHRRVRRRVFRQGSSVRFDEASGVASPERVLSPGIISPSNSSSALPTSPSRRKFQSAVLRLMSPPNSQSKSRLLSPPRKSHIDASDVVRAFTSRQSSHLLSPPRKPAEPKK